MTAYTIRGKILLDTSLVDGAVVVEGDRITRVVRGDAQGSLPAPVLETAIVAPGFIDLQVNGGFGCEVGEDPAALRRLAERLPGTGVTSFLPTVVTSPEIRYPVIEHAVRATRGAPGARILGLHLEGPYISPARAGAHRPHLVQTAETVGLDSLFRDEVVRMVTLAPEQPGARALIRRLAGQGVVVSLGHTDASYEEFEAGVDAGATAVTHLYNALSPFTHRAPGAVGAALVDDRVTAGLITDGIHSHPAAVALAMRSKGTERIALVTDMMAAVGMPAGTYSLGGQAVRADGSSAHLQDGTLAGSLLTMDSAIRNVVRWGVASVGEALSMASAVPARLLGLSRAGRMAAGYVADLVLLDSSLNVRVTIVGGVPRAGSSELVDGIFPYTLSYAPPACDS